MSEKRDIVNDLRNAGQPTMPSFGQPGDAGVPLMMEAAAEIERLREAMARIRLRVAGRQTPAFDEVCSVIDAALAPTQPRAGGE